MKEAADVTLFEDRFEFHFTEGACQNGKESDDNPRPAEPV